MEKLLVVFVVIGVLALIAYMSLDIYFRIGG